MNAITACRDNQERGELRVSPWWEQAGAGPCGSSSAVPLNWGLPLCKPLLLGGLWVLAPPALLLVISFSLCVSFLLSFPGWAGLEMLCLLFN